MQHGEHFFHPSMPLSIFQTALKHGKSHVWAHLDMPYLFLLRALLISSWWAGKYEILVQSYSAY